MLLYFLTGLSKGILGRVLNPLAQDYLNHSDGMSWKGFGPASASKRFKLLVHETDSFESLHWLCTGKSLWPCTGTSLWLCTGTGLWFCTGTALWLYTGTGLWLCTGKCIGLCTGTGIWLSTGTSLWLCTDTGLWPCTDKGLWVCTGTDLCVTHPSEQIKYESILPLYHFKLSEGLIFPESFYKSWF